MRRTLWLAISPWLVAAVAGAGAAGLGAVLVDLFTTEDGGMGNLGGTLVGAGLAILAGTVATVGLLYVVARQAFGARIGAAAVGGHCSGRCWSACCSRPWPPPWGLVRRRR